MGHQTRTSLLLSIFIIGVSLLGRGNCDREEKSLSTARDDNDDITPSPRLGSTDGWRPVIPTAEDSSLISARSHNSYRHVHAGNSDLSINSNVNSHSNSHGNSHVNSHGNSHSSEDQHKHVNINRHPVLNKLQAHMELAEKAKLKRQQEEAAEASRVNEPFFSTTPNILGSFSSFGHATVRNKEPAGSQQEAIKGKKKKHDPYNFQVSESINEYSYHLVPPPMQQKAPARYPAMAMSDPHRRKKPHTGYRYPNPDLMVEEQRHAYYVQGPPPRNPYLGLSTHTPKPPGYFYGGPQIPNFAGLPHHYPGALAGALFPGPDSIRYFQRPDIHNSGGSQFTHPPPIPLDSSKHGRPQENIDQSYRRPDLSPYKNTQHQEEYVTGPPPHDVRSSGSNSFTVGSSFLAGNKHEDNKRPSQQFQSQVHSSVLPPTFEQAFETGRPSSVKEESTGYRIPTTLSNPHSEKNRFTKPFTPNEVIVTNVQNIQITGPSHTRHQMFDSMFPPGVVEDSTPPFLPTVTSQLNPFVLKDYPTPSPHLNEIHQTSPPWSTKYQPQVIDVVEVQGPPSVRDEQTSQREPAPSEERPRPVSTSNIDTYNQAQEDLEKQSLTQNVHQAFETQTERLPSYEEEQSTEDPPALQATEVTSEESERRPHHGRKPSRHRPRPATHQDESGNSQHDERPLRRPAYPKYPTSSVEEPTRTSEDENPPKEVRQKQRRRRPQPIVKTEEVKTLPTVEEDGVDTKYNHIDGDTEKHIHTTTARPRRKNPYGNRGQERHRIRTTTTTEPNPIAEAFESQVAVQEVQEHTPTPYNAAKDYAVHEDDQESAYESSTLGYVEDATQEDTTSTTTSTTTTTTTTSTTTPPPEATTTAATTVSRYKPRLRFGSNSTRPRFSVKDYKDRITRLPQTTEKKETTTATPTETESFAPKRHIGRIRGSYQKQAEKTEEEEAIQVTTVESLRHRYRPKFGTGSSRYRTTTAPPASEELDTASTKRAKLPPTGKFYSRYRSTTETPLEEKIDLESSPSETVTSVVTPRLPMRPKGAYSPRLRFPPRVKYGSQNEINTTEAAAEDDADSATNQIDVVKPVGDSVTTRTEVSTNFATTDSETVAETSPTTPNLFADFEETSKMIENEVATKATKTFMFMPTMPSMFQYDYENHKEESKTERTKDEESFTASPAKDVVVPDIEAVDMKSDDDGSASQRVADLTSAATSGGYFNTMLIAKRKPISRYTMATEDPILPIEAFFTNTEYHRE